MTTGDTTRSSKPSSGDANIPPPRLPYPTGLETRFPEIDRGAWKALTEAVFPAARTPQSIVLALTYCKARKLDPFKRTIHIVPIWDSQRKCEVETVWPGIAELRTTAFRTGDYAGRDKTEFGDECEESWQKTDRDGNSQEIRVKFPQWAQVTVYRIVKGQRVPFVGPKVYWRESYGRTKSNCPNDMWAKRPYGQLDKVAEAGALRGAFPEELGSEYAAEEVEGSFTWHGRPAIEAPTEQPKQITHSRVESLADRLVGGNGHNAECSPDGEQVSASSEPLALESQEPSRSDVLEQEYAGMIDETQDDAAAGKLLAGILANVELSDAAKERLSKRSNDSWKRRNPAAAAKTGNGRKQQQSFAK